MLVKVSRKYCGTFGIFNKGTNSVVMKDNASAPFEMDDALARVHLERGILVAGDADEEEAAEAFEEETLPEEPEEASEEISEELPGEEEVPDGIPEENPEDADDLESINDYKVLKQMAKEAGINPVGKNKQELKDAIRESREA